MFISENRYLSKGEMQINAIYIARALIPMGWTMNAICGMLGNMQTESTINPGIWENLDYGNMEGGYGLVQWTPASKYIIWAESRGLERDHMDSQLARIEWEVANNQQWIHPNMTFKEFKESTDTPYNLAMLFLKHYERPADPNQPIRGTQANEWWEFLNDTPLPDPGGEIPENFFILTRKQPVLRRRTR